MGTVTFQFENGFTVVVVFRVQSMSKLNARVSPWKYNWAVATLEEYSIRSCDQNHQKPVTFDTIALHDSTGSTVHPLMDQS